MRVKDAWSFEGKSSNRETLRWVKGQVISYARIGIESTVAVLMKGKPQKRPAFF